ncbi:ammonia-forming cytochrome c nitrite reductase subunit c552 [Candidatus Bathyarchaeota archaeon]|nr:ammonia-forming cytochrome c nitrite reductase subunit c552 [Candidatus Bathyarchaeota archaeon]NIV43760.1 ammonia-forming cytochrome c nitrite reductase subunit c552 [Candidatus Bathyarchaeota archaeon]
MARSKHFPLILFLFIVIVGISLSLPKNLPTARSSNGPTYVGAETCASCHPDAYDGWNETSHAHAVMLIQNASGNFYSVGAADNLAGTPSRVYNETRFRGSCRDCHVTGGNNFDPLGEINQSWPERTTDPAKFLNIQCEVCHGAGVEEPWGEASMIIDYSAALCELCHQIGSSHDNSHWQSAHAQSITDLLASDHAADRCLSCMSTQGALGQDVSLDTPDLASVSCAVCHDPHSHTYEAQLRYENSTELCGQCHSQAELFEDSAHSKAGLECASCHGQGSHFAHGHESATINHTWGVYGMYYPYNQTEAEEPIVCSTCHTQSWATSQLGVIQDLTTGLVTNVTETIDDAKAAITIANQTSGVDQTEIDEAEAMVEAAEDYLHDVDRDGSEGFHDPEQTFAILSTAAHLASDAESKALQARSDALASETTSLEAQVSSLETQVTSLEDQTTTLQSDIETLEAKIDDLESASTTVPYLYGGIGIALGFAVGAAIVFFVRRGKP